MIYAIQDQGSREYQEDMFDIELINGYLYIGLFDGHNGDYVSKFLKENLKKEIRQRLNSIPMESIIDINDNKTIPKIIYDSLEKIQNSLNKEKFHVGSTALIVLKNKNRIYIANTGDSRGIVSNHNEIITITEDHNPYLEREFKRVTNNEGKIIQDQSGLLRVMGTLALTRAMGDEYLQKYITWKPDLYSISLKDSDNIIILASDGIWDVYKSEDLFNFINTNKSMIDQNMLELVVKDARDRGSTDNITLVVSVNM